MKRSIATSDPPAPGAGTPLTDPWSVLGSVTFHALLLLAASLAALTATRPDQPPRATSIRAEVGPIDNLAPPPGGGGGPGDSGGFGPDDGTAVPVDPVESSPTTRGHDAALLSGLLAAGREVTPPEERDAGGIAHPGVGVIPGPGLGGGGGAGGGTGGGQGGGVGPSAVFFGTTDQAASFAYTIDRSGSMSGHNALNFAKRELLASLSQLPPDARFSVIFYNLQPIQVSGSMGSGGLVPATQAAKEEVRARLAEIDAEGGTDHARALREAFAAGPEVVFLLTDGFHMSIELAERLRTEAGSIRIHVIEFGVGAAPMGSDPVRWLAGATGGSYRYVDVTRLGEPGAVR